MSLIKRIILAIARNLGKSLLLFLAVFITVSLLTVFNRVRMISFGIEDSIKSQLDNYIGLTYNDSSGISSLDPVEIKDVEEKIETFYEDVRSKEYCLASNAVIVSNITFDIHLSSSERNFYTEVPFARLSGIIHADNLIFDEYLELLDGRYITDEDITSAAYVLMIPDDWTYEDGSPIAIGDMISLDFSKESNGFDYDGTYEFAVIAKFKAKDDFNEIYNDVGFRTLATNFIVPATTIEKINEDIIGNINIEDLDESETNNLNYHLTTAIEGVLFRLNSVDHFNDVMNMLDPSLAVYYVTVSSADEFNTVKAPLENLNMLANGFLSIGIIVSAIVLFLVLFLYLRFRNHELGTLLSMGESKGKIVIMIVIEVLIIGFVAILAALVLGRYGADIFTEYFLRNSALPEVSLNIENDGRYFGILTLIITLFYLALVTVLNLLIILRQKMRRLLM